MSHMIADRLRALIAGLLVSALLVAPAAGVAEAANNTTFSGQATVLQGQVAGICLDGLPPSGSPPKCQGGIVDTGPIAPGSTEANLHAALICYAVPNNTGCLVSPPNLTGNTLNAEVLHAAVVARGDTSRAEASVANFSFSAEGVQIGADLLQARAEAHCTGSGAVVKAGAERNVPIHGNKYSVGAGQTQEVTLTSPLGVDLGYVVIKEGAGEKSGNSIDASALHVVIPAANTDVTVAAVHADVVCASALNCPGKNAFVTGGGFIDQAGSKAHFAIAGRNGEAWGHVLYKPTSLHVKNPNAIVANTSPALASALNDHPEFTQFQQYFPNGVGSTFQGAAILYWTDGTAKTIGSLLAIDMGEPGRSDYFEIAGLNDARQLASIAAGTLQGGNIQMHGKCPS